MTRDLSTHVVEVDIQSWMDNALDEQHEAIQKVYDFVNNVRRRGY